MFGLKHEFKKVFRGKIVKSFGLFPTLYLDDACSTGLKEFYAHSSKPKIILSFDISINFLRLGIFQGVGFKGNEFQYPARRGQ